jgi:hypothetical protein
MAWGDEALIDGHDTILYVQAAGTVGAPGTADEVPYATAFSWSHPKERSTRGSWINYAGKKTTESGGEKSGALTIDMHAAADAPREVLLLAAEGSDRVKFTLFVGGANGDKRVWDDVSIDEEGEVGPNEGVPITFNWVADTYTRTPGTYA